MIYKPVILLKLLILLIILNSCNQHNKKLELSKNAMSEIADIRFVSTEVIEKGTFSIQSITNGILMAKSNVTLSFNKNSTLAKVNCRNGQIVNKGILLAELENSNEKIAVEKAKESLKYAELELNSLLLGFGGISGDTSSIKNGLLQNLKVQSGYTVAQLNLKSSESNLRDTYLYSPIKGIIADLKKNEFDIVSPSEPFCKIINNEYFIAEFNIMESELPVIKTGQNITVKSIAYDSINLVGTICGINPVVDKNGFIMVQAEVKNPYVYNKNNIQLLDGMNVKVIIETIIENVLSVPKRAIVLRSGKQVVFTYNNGSAKWNYVETSSENSTHYLINEGLHANDTIITSGNLHLAHDVLVQIKSK